MKRIFIIIIIITVAVFVGAYFLLQQSVKLLPSSNLQFRQNEHGESASKHIQQENGGYGFKKPFYRQDGISLQHYWPGEASFSNEEAEILLLNESNSNVGVKSFDLTYIVEGKTYPQKSGTWEKFPSKTSWDKIEYLSISSQYYKGELLSLTPGQKGKLHWHIQFGSQPLDGKQIIKLKLMLVKGTEVLRIDEEFHRNAGSVFSSSDH